MNSGDKDTAIMTGMTPSEAFEHIVGNEIDGQEVIDLHAAYLEMAEQIEQKGQKDMNSYELAGLSVKDGTKIRRLEWDSNRYIYHSKGFWYNSRDHIFNDLDGLGYVDGWELYVEPKKKRTIYVREIYSVKDVDLAILVRSGVCVSMEEAYNYTHSLSRSDKYPVKYRITAEVVE